MDVGEAERLVRSLKMLGVQDIGRSWYVYCYVVVRKRRDSFLLYTPITSVLFPLPPLPLLPLTGGYVSIAQLIV